MEEKSDNPSNIALVNNYLEGHWTSIKVGSAVRNAIVAFNRDPDDKMVFNLPATDLRAIANSPRVAFASGTLTLSGGTLGAQTTTADNVVSEELADLEVVLEVNSDPSFNADYRYRELEPNVMWDDSAGAIDVTVRAEWSTDPGSGERCDAGVQGRPRPLTADEVKTNRSIVKTDAAWWIPASLYTTSGDGTKSNKFTDGLQAALDDKQAS